MPKYNAFIFDMNGTMINDMHYHELAWYKVIVEELGAPLTQEELKHQLYGKNEELFERVFGATKFTKEEVDSHSLRKELRYREEFLPYLKLIDGLDTFLTRAKSEKIKLAIGTAAIVGNVDYVLDNLNLRNLFSVIIGPDDVAVSKPHPEVFLKAAQGLKVMPEECVVFEDSPKGIEAARRAGMKAVGVASYHTADELQNTNVLCVINDYNDKTLNSLVW
ncbi:HAD family hydrolase [Chryseosolibacter indicus]|uniref:HAD family phosphatase n=1 Tax=Chryseosolibacter indicus TaxID=2782351 RepID=A0ABS5VRV2_9BACT|nr:HAD family phosphatase [Chryseosolibacter indicus]MBT1703763.1 HAD family phosphatase [Chryseosolibacter indicus]